MLFGRISRGTDNGGKKCGNSRRAAVTVFGFDYPDVDLDSLLEGDVSSPIQTRLFARRLTKAIQFDTDLPICCISAAPISEFPSNPRIYVNGSKSREIHTEEGSVEFKGLPFVNRGVLKVFTRQISTLLATFGRARYQRGGYVFVYSVHVPFLFGGLLLSRLANATSVGVWTDPPGVIPPNGRRLGVFVRKLEGRWARFLCRRFDKIVTVTRGLAEELAPSSAALVVEAISEPTPRPIPQYRGRGKTIVTYTGGVSKKYGVDILVRAVLALPETADVELYILGGGDYASELMEIATENCRIHYVGVVTHEEALSYQERSDFLINTRNPNDEFTKLSFPSKTLEYLASGVPVLSTRLPGVPSEYWKVMLPIEEFSTKAIAATITRAGELSADAREKLGIKGRELVMDRSYKAQGRRIWQFVAGKGSGSESQF